MSSETKTAVALGNFDGLHKGHKAVIACALSYKERGLIPVVLLFDCHPLKALTGSAPPELLQKSLRDEMIKKEALVPAYISFSEISDMSPEEFFKSIIIDKLNACAVCCGENYRFGKGASGDISVLENLCRENGVAFSSVALVNYEGTPISSTRIRNALSLGETEKANDMLGYEFAYKLPVSSGSHIGRLMGTPTINQLFPDGFSIPKTGVYASAAVIDGREYPAVTNIGTRPTFDGNSIRSETFIIDFNENLYSKEIEIHLLSYLREEIKFPDVTALKEQIESDADKALLIYNAGRSKNV